MWSLNGGGAELSTPHYIPKLINWGCDVEITALTKGDLRAEPVIRKLGVPWVLLYDGGKYFFKKFYNLLKSLRKKRPDLLWASLPGATLVAVILGRIFSIPVISWQHNAYLSKKNYFLYKLISNRIHHWVADSKATRKFLHDNFSINGGKISILPLFIADSDIPTHSHHKFNKIQIGTIGKLEKQKGYDFLLQTANYLKRIYPEGEENITFHIAGDGPEKENLEMQRKNLKLNNVFFHGFTKDIQSFLKKMDVYFQPSRWEGLCIAALEASLAGIPLVASNTGGLTDFVENRKSGFLIKPGDIVTYAKALNWLSINPAKRAEMGEWARNFAMEEYSQIFFDKNLHALYLNLQRAASKNNF
jgi:glycosyltransferase involved in cell wall biosynthesis